MGGWTHAFRIHTQHWEPASESPVSCLSTATKTKIKMHRIGRNGDDSSTNLALHMRELAKCSRGNRSSRESMSMCKVQLISTKWARREWEKKWNFFHITSDSWLASSFQSFFAVDRARTLLSHATFHFQIFVLEVQVQRRRKIKLCELWSAALLTRSSYTFSTISSIFPRVSNVNSHMELFRTRSSTRRSPLTPNDVEHQRANGGENDCSLSCGRHKRAQIMIFSIRSTREQR